MTWWKEKKYVTWWKEREGKNNNKEMARSPAASVGTGTNRYRKLNQLSTGRRSELERQMCKWPNR